MFASLKNKIREETGSDLSKLTAKIASSTSQRLESLRGRGSSSSVNSLISSDGAKEDGCDTSKTDDDLKKKNSKFESELSKKLEEKQKEWKESSLEKDRRLQNLEKEKYEAYKQISKLKEALKVAEDFKNKILQQKENKEQVECFQSQELVKIKNLILQRDQELAEKNQTIKDLSQQLDKLKSEIGRLRRQEERLSDVQQDAETEVKAVRKNLDNSESQLEKTEEERSKLKISVDSEHQTNATLRQIITKLEKELNEEKNNSLDVQKTLSRVTAEKNAALLRNAEISQQIDLAKQEARRKGLELNEFSNKLAQLEIENQKYKELESKNIEQDLRNNITRLEEQLIEKNKNIKTLQLRLLDMKKALQQELRAPTKDPFSDYSDSNSVAILAPSQNLTRNYHNSLRKDEDDINHKYLKHVVIKFLTSREYEAIHLIRAIATLLKFSPEEEKLIQDTLEWKMSWFGKSRPSIGNGQLAKAIPPS